MTTPFDEKSVILTMKMQAILEGESNADIVAACNYIIANAVAILAHDRADADRILKQCGREQRKLLDGAWDQVRAVLEQMKRPS